MSRVVTSPVAKYPGTVTLVSPVPLDEYLDWMDANQDAMATQRMRERVKAYLPGICALIEGAAVAGLPEHPTPDDFRKLTGQPAFELITWLVVQCQQVMTEEEARPNE